jgi:hypothetical protein
MITDGIEKFGNCITGAPMKLGLITSQLQQAGTDLLAVRSFLINFITVVIDRNVPDTKEDAHVIRHWAEEAEQLTLNEGYSSDSFMPVVGKGMIEGLKRNQWTFRPVDPALMSEERHHYLLYRFLFYFAFSLINGVELTDEQQQKALRTARDQVRGTKKEVDFIVNEFLEMVFSQLSPKDRGNIISGMVEEDPGEPPGT